MSDDKRHNPNQRILVIEINGYAFLVPYVEDEEGIFLKTVIPSRKATRDYLGTIAADEGGQDAST